MLDSVQCSAAYAPALVLREGKYEVQHLTAEGKELTAEVHGLTAEFTAYFKTL